MIIVKKGDYPRHIEEAGKHLIDITHGFAGMEKGIDHLSPSSISNLEECANMLRLRNKYRFFSLYATLGNIFHSILEQYGARKSYFIQHKLHGPVYTEGDFAHMKAVVVDNFIDGIRTDLIIGKLIISPRIPAKIEHQIGDMDLIRSVAHHLVGFFTMELADEAAIGGLFPMLQESEVRGIIGRNLPVLGFIDSIKLSDDLKTAYVDDYKTAWTPQSKKNWEAAVIPTRQFWIYKKLVEENIRDLIPTVENVVPRLLLLSMTGSFVSQAMSGKNKTMTLEGVLKSKPEYSLYVKEFESQPLVDAQYENEIAMVEVMLENKIEIVARSKYGCGSCDYKQKCEYYRTINNIEDEEESNGAETRTVPSNS